MADESHTRFFVRYYDSPRAGRLALVTMDNGEDWNQPTTLGDRALASLRDALDDIKGQDDVKGLLLTGKQFVFAVGADIKQFAGVDSDEAREAGRAGHELFGRLHDLPFPTLAAINGACMGGGLEIALHCDFRTLSSNVSRIAFPEVFLSIVPAWGGTQLAPRVVGGANALEVIVHNALDNNRQLDAQQAFELGFADELLEPVDLFEDSLTILEDLVAGEREVPQRPGGSEPGDDLEEALDNARSFARQKVHDGTRAPYAAIDLIEFAALGGDLAAGYEREEDILAELLPARQAQSAVYAFQLTQQRVKKQPWRPDAAARDLGQVAIVGAGTMGAQLGALCLQKLEVPVVMKDIDRDILDGAREHIEGELDAAVQKGKLTEGRARFLEDLVTYTLDYDALAGSDFVIEAVLEEMDLKKQVWSEVEAVVEPGAVFASNTSSLSVAEQAADLEHPERVIGFHFFNPVKVLPLLEIARWDGASDEALATGFEVSKRLRKSGIQCQDTPAFIANRLMMRFNGAATAALQHGNPFRDIDDAIKQLGLPMGPFELFGFVGMEVALHTLETLHAAWPERFPMDENFQRIAQLDIDGIYDWERGGEPYEQVLELTEVDPDAEPLTGGEIRQRALEATAEEARIMLENGDVADARDLDTALLLGAGWPFFVGGICKYADETGLSEKLFGERLIAAEDRASA